MESRVLIVDLSTRTARAENIPENYLDDYLGGRGLGARLLYEHVAKGVDPLGPENVVIFAAGPLQGSKAFYSSKSVLITKSPQTGIYLYTVASGSFCTNVAKCGFSALIIRGKAEKPTYLSIKDDKVEFKDASNLWGMTTSDADAFIQRSVGREASIATIGPAGENLVRYAAVITEGRQRQAFGRGGAGAVMGSKNLKAVAIRGTKDVPVADAQAMTAAQKKVVGKLDAAPQFTERQKLYGTRGGLSILNDAGILPTRNWQVSQFSDIEAFNNEMIRQNYIVDGHACAPYCPAPCFHWCLVREGQYKSALTFGPEYETIYSFGTAFDNPRFDSIIQADYLCDTLGLDSMSAGLTLSWVAECVEKGILTAKDLDGLDVSFGRHKVFTDMLYKIAYREGIGDLLAEGSYIAAKKIGKGSEDWAMTSKGMEFGGYECRASWGQAIQFAVSQRGGCHHDLGLPARAELGKPEATTVKGRGQSVKILGCNRVIFDSATLCGFPLAILGMDSASALLTAVMGRELTVPLLQEIGERTLNLERLFNVREGVDREQDRLPKRLLKEVLTEGPSKGRVVPLEELKDEFYGAMGWDLTIGAPTSETLARLRIKA